MVSQDVGLWLVGARGSIATTVIVGVATLASDLVQPTGLVTSLPPFANVGLADVGRIVVGGHDIVDRPVHKRAESLVSAGVLPSWAPGAVADELAVAEAELREGVSITQAREDPLGALQRLEQDLLDFRAAHGLEVVVVVNVASTEARLARHRAHADLAMLRAALARGAAVLPCSGLYAVAAMEAGCAWVDFTPGPTTRLAALAALATERGVPYAGRDGKTGETLVKAALAPLFADRALRVRSWTGTNLLGGGDGVTLASPGARQSKLDSKSRSLTAILGYPVEAPVRIDYVQDLGEWKTAWDHITFEGFLGTRMRMQFTWEGCDSALAAPLVIDLTRLMARAYAAGRHGAQSALAFFFKDPVGTDQHRLTDQFATLCAWAAGFETGS